MSIDVSAFPEHEFTLHGSFRAKPGRGDELEEYLRHLVRLVKSEPGTIFYQVARDQKDRLKFLIFETYAGRAAFQTHLDSQEFQNLWNSNVLDGALEPSLFVAMESA
ncbi:hypothetical protein B0I35DRAFT_439556 [Stachybotrys elegans]|uniref:ABM domain-containing protein n=1 Tax=Stachybotrys elegans TaxID=80388 RepID=A0A8K0SK99_9HYPO|nr:hypothetical protein B0I35DRAFT_439556 [Stachybotrys elegans]